MRARLPKALRTLRSVGWQIYNVQAMLFVDLPDQAATETVAMRIAAVAEPADIIALKGELGAGKTTFARAFIRARGNLDEVPSPTFTLVQVYEAGPAAIWHFDLYRLRQPEDAWELGIEDAFASAISLIEWPERLGQLLPQRRLQVSFSYADSPGARHASLDPGTGWRERLPLIAADA